MADTRREVSSGKERSLNSGKLVDHDAKESGILCERVAWHVAERTLKTLGFSNAAKGFELEDVVKSSFDRTFGARIPTRSLKRKCSEPLKVPVGCSVVDAALGTLGYDTKAICDREISRLISIFTSSVKSKLSNGSYPLTGSLCGLEYENGKIQQSEESLRAGCLQTFSAGDFLQMVESCAPFLFAYANGRQALQVMDALLGAAVNISVVTPYSEARHSIYKKLSSDEKSFARAIQSVLACRREGKEGMYSKLDPCSRLHIWRLHPYYFKEDIAHVVRHAMDHPLLSLKDEIQKSKEWPKLIACLALAPDVFGEARRLLHNWFLATDSVRLLELRAELVAALWSVLNDPPLWGFAQQVYLPPQHAFYSLHFRPLLVILRCNPTVAGLMKVVDLIDGQESGNHHPSKFTLVEQGCNSSETVAETAAHSKSQSFVQDCHDSLWPQLLDFLCWLQFSIRVLFRKEMRQKAASTPLQDDAATKNPFNLKERARSGKPENVAAKFIAWMMEPVHPWTRRSIELMLLQLRRDWDRASEAISEKGPRDVAIDDHLREEGPSWQRSRCRVLRPDSERQKGCDGKEGPCRSSEAIGQDFSAVDAWLADLRTNLTGLEQGQREVNRTNDEAVGDTRRETGAEAGPPMPSLTSSIHPDWQQKLLYTKYLPLGALIEALPWCSPGLISRILQFVLWGGNLNCPHCKGSNIEARGCSAGCSSVRYDACCSRQCRNSSRFGAQCLDHRLGSQTCPHCQDGRLFDWNSSGSAIFDFLDAVNVNELPGLGTSEPNADTVIDWKAIQGTLAAVMSQLLLQWVIPFETHSSPTVHLICSRKDSHLASLLDLRSRFCAWLEKLHLTPNILAQCNLATEMLDDRISNLHSVLLSS